MYDELNKFDKTLARFGDRVSLIAGLEISGKLSAEQAYDEIKKLYKELKTTYKITTKEEK
jgi:hypothetical protein